MALTTKSLTLISISALLLMSIEAQLAPSTTPVSYISSSPDASPATAPAPATEGSNIFDVIGDIFSTDIPLPDFSTSEMAVEPSVENQKQVAMVIEKSMQKMEQKLDEFSVALKKRLEDPESSATTQECINQCDEVYGAAKDDIKNSLDALNSGNFVKANFDISAVSTNVDTCEQCFNEMIGVDPELKKFDEWVRGITSQALGSLEEVSS